MSESPALRTPPTATHGAHAAAPDDRSPAAVSGPPTVPGRHRAAATVPTRNGSDRSGVLWPLAALVVVGLVAARGLRGSTLPEDGALAGPAAALLRGVSGPDALSPAGLGALHTAVYATVTRAFQRHATLVGAERELLLVLLLGAAVLLWRTAHRLDVPHGACAVGVLALGALPVFASLHATATPAAFAVGWLVLAGWVAGWASTSRRPPAVLPVLTVLAAVLAVLLAPDALLLLTAGGTAAMVLAARTPGRRIRAALAGVVLLGLLRVLVQRWDPQVADPQRWGGTPTRLVVVTAVLVAVGLAAVWRLPRSRAAGAALVATALLAVAPPSGRLPALLLCLPLGALLLGALAAASAEAVSAPALRGRPRALLAVGVVAGVLLLGAGTAAAADLARTRSDDFGAAATRDLVGWSAEQLPDGAVLRTSPRLAAELVHAGADPARVRASGDAPGTASTGAEGQVLQVRQGASDAGGPVVARFGDLAVVDPQVVPPTPQQLTARRDLAAALLANPTVAVPTADADRMAAGQVDPRLLTLLASIGAQDGLELVDLPAVPGEPADAALRRVVLGSVGGRPLADDPAAGTRLRRWLDAQQEPFLPDRVADVDGGLLIGYTRAADPDALVTPPGGR
ncbi:hypothetical protein [Modestobacter altitudinis]|uniref:hypothetical protein n=1 Tax=Modestobacter altitudinis TaxID=2213158 RepID=UPI00110CA3F2|nr:hypothetical protein [Modestobacter altitudinis]